MVDEHTIPEKKPEEGTIDFTSSIDRLEKRSKRARRKVLIVFMFLFFFVSLFVTVIFYSQSQSNLIAMDRIKFEISNRRSTIEEPFLRQLNALTDSLIGPSYPSYIDNEKKFIRPDDSTSTILKKEIRETLELYKTAYQINKSENTGDDASSIIASTISSGVFSLGAVAFVILLIQIAIMFMRYYTRLAELYEAQAEALKASGGNAELAYRFMEKFSPNVIELGKTPTTLYEKALDTVKEVAKK